MSASDQKYTEFRKYLHYHFASDWMTLTQDLKAIKISQRKDFTTKEFESLNVGEQKLLTKTSF